MRKFALIIILEIIPFFLIAQTSFQDSVYQVYENGTGVSKYEAAYSYAYNLMQTDTAKVIEQIIKFENEVENSNLNLSDKNYSLAGFYEIRGRVELLKGNKDKELFYFQKMIDISQGIDDNRKYIIQGIPTTGRGMYYSHMGLIDKAKKEFLLAAELFTKAEPLGKVSLANSYGHLAQIHTKKMDFDSVLIYSNRALELIEHNTNIPNHNFFISLKANAFNEMNLPDSSITILDKDYIEKSKSFSVVNCAILNLNLSDSYSLKKDIKNAQIHLQNAEDIMESSNAKVVLKEYYLNSKFNYSLATEDYYKTYLDLTNLTDYRDSTSRTNMETQLLALQTKYETQSKDFQIQTLETNNRYQSNMMKLGGSLFLIIIATLFSLFKNREAKIKVIQAKNNQQIKVAFKYNEPNPEIEDNFLKNIIQSIQENLTNENFTVDDLVKHSGMSRNAMNKKIKSLTNKTAVGLIRDVRLDKAHSLLLKNNKNVSEIAFEVGFKEPNYFSSCFREKFGYPPSEILKK